MIMYRDIYILFRLTNQLVQSARLVLTIKKSLDIFNERKKQKKIKLN